MFEEAIKELIEQVASRAAEAAVQRFALEHQPKPSRYGVDMTVPQLMERMKKAKQTIYQMNSRGAIPGAHHIGSRLVFRTSEVLPWIEAGCPTLNTR